MNKYKESFDVYIDRPSLFGNPYTVKKYRRGNCVPLYRKYFYNRIDYDHKFREEVHKLEGKTLGCFCKPKSCHGDIIIEYLEGMKEKK